MKEYTIYFEIFGKKMKTTIHALSEERAINILRSKINIDKVEEKIDRQDQIKHTDSLIKDIFGSNPFGKFS